MNLLWAHPVPWVLCALWDLGPMRKAWECGQGVVRQACWMSAKGPSTGARPTRVQGLVPGLVGRTPINSRRCSGLWAADSSWQASRGLADKAAWQLGKCDSFTLSPVQKGEWHTSFLSVQATPNPEKCAERSLAACVTWQWSQGVHLFSFSPSLHPKGHVLWCCVLEPQTGSGFLLWSTSWSTSWGTSWRTSWRIS